MAQAKSPNLREMKRMISIDLVEAALAHRQFLKLVDDNPCLYTGPHVENAVRRYESVLRIQSRTDKCKPSDCNQSMPTPTLRVGLYCVSLEYFVRLKIFNS